MINNRFLPYQSLAITLWRPSRLILNIASVFPNCNRLSKILIGGDSLIENKRFEGFFLFSCDLWVLIRIEGISLQISRLRSTRIFLSQFCDLEGFCGVVLRKVLSSPSGGWWRRFSGNPLCVDSIGSIFLESIGKNKIKESFAFVLCHIYIFFVSLSWVEYQALYFCSGLRLSSLHYFVIFSLIYSIIPYFLFINQKKKKKQRNGCVLQV